MNSTIEYTYKISIDDTTMVNYNVKSGDTVGHLEKAVGPNAIHL